MPCNVEFLSRLVSHERFASGEFDTGLIEDDADRESAFMNVALFWLTTDKAAAEAWIAQAPLSDETVDRIRNPRKHRVKRPETPDPEAQVEPEQG